MSDPGFRRNRDGLIDAMKKSLDARDNGEQLLCLQAELANSVIHAQAELRKIKRGERKFDSSEQRERFVDSSKTLVHVLHAIADGIAWRTLAFDRAAIHELAFHNQTGHMELQTVMEEVTRAGEILAEDVEQAVILNDLTNFLRFGDLTIVRGNSVSIYEVKAGRGAAKSGQAKLQKQRLRKVLEILNSSDQLEAGDHKLMRVDAKPASYQEEVYEIINRARKNGHASGRLSNSTAISVFDIKVASELKLTPAQVLSNPFSGARFLYPYDSSALLGLFTPNVAPYSVFPLPPEDRVDLMMGKLVVVTWLDAERLMEAVSKRGLNARMPTKKDFEGLPTDLKPGQIREHELDVAIEFTKPGRSMRTATSILSRVGYEFLSEESFVDMIEEGLTRANVSGETFYQAFKEEDWLWD
jgi:hypothetical protein